MYLNPNFQASSHLLRLRSPVCVGPGRNPRRQVFSRQCWHNQEVMKLSRIVKKLSFACAKLIRLGSANALTQFNKYITCLLLRLYTILVSISEISVCS